MIVGLFQRQIWLGPLLGILIGLAIGLPAGWMTVSFQPGKDDVRMVAEALATNNNANLAKARLANLSKDDRDRYLTDLFNEANKNGRRSEAQNLYALAQVFGSPTLSLASIPPVSGTPLPSSSSASAVGTPGTGTASSSVAPTPRTVPGASPTPAVAGGDLLGSLVPIILILVVVVLAAAAGLVFVTRILPKMRQGRAGRERPAGTEPTTAEAAQWSERVAGGTAPAPTTQPGGLGRFVPQYTLGNDNYDTSYSLETPRGEFLGECGMGISETIGEGKPDKVTAFDLWLFDKADVRTVTQIIMSDYAFNDQTLRTKLRDKGEAVLAEKGKTIHLETQSLRIDAQIVELIYASNPNLAPNSHFQKLIIEIVPTLKNNR